MKSIIQHLAAAVGVLVIAVAVLPSPDERDKLSDFSLSKILVCLSLLLLLKAILLIVEKVRDRRALRRGFEVE